ncbi:MAG: tRNA (adenosine(37)-N6)-threonylcarbamoyltransferase complex ATPase subunit type 1 TsaE [Pseudomonadota bacterium]
MYETLLLNKDATLALGAALAPLLQQGDMIALWGGLGAGKTTLARGLLTSLCGEIDVPSPTFTLVQTYSLPAYTLWHFDLYRLKDPSELNELAWEDTVEGVALVEWPERAGDSLPVWRLDVTLIPEDGARRARLEPQGEDWQKRLDDDSFRFPR